MHTCQPASLVLLGTTVPLLQRGLAASSVGTAGSQALLSTSEMSHVQPDTKLKLLHSRNGQ